jgi:allophanate hydrolase subunit 1
MSSQQRKISIAGENSLIVYFGGKPTAAIASQIAQTASQLRETIGQVLVDLVPSYGSLLVIYNPLQTDHHAVRAAIRQHSAI